MYVSLYWVYFCSTNCKYAVFATAAILKKSYFYNDLDFKDLLRSSEGCLLWFTLSAWLNKFNLTLKKTLKKTLPGAAWVSNLRSPPILSVLQSNIDWEWDCQARIGESVALSRQSNIDWGSQAKCRKISMQSTAGAVGKNKSSYNSEFSRHHLFNVNKTQRAMHV